MFSDLRHACRALARSPGFAITAVAALGLGIGSNAAIFSVIDATLLHPAGVSDPGRVVALVVNYAKLNLKNLPVVSVPDFTDARNSRQVFEHAAVMQEGDLNYTGSGVPERLRGALVSHDLV